MHKTSRRIPGLLSIALTTLAAGAAQSEPAAAEGASPSLGTLEYGPTLYYPQGCAHNGSTVVCTFVFVHQAESASIHAGGGGSQLTGIQFVDDAHVPHAPNNAYFVDRYGARQHLLTVNRGDQGTMMVEFPLVDPRVSSGELHLGTQVLGGIPVGQGAGGPGPGAPNTLAAGNTQAEAPAAGGARAGTPPAANVRQASAAQPVAAAQSASGCTPQMANNSACKLANKINGANNSLNNGANAVAAPANAVKQLGDTIGNLFGKKPAQAPAATPQP
jgi:hypothetical protein